MEILYIIWLKTIVREYNIFASLQLVAPTSNNAVINYIILNLSFKGIPLLLLLSLVFVHSLLLNTNFVKNTQHPHVDSIEILPISGLNMHCSDPFTNLVSL